MAESSAKLKKKQVDPLKRTVFSLALPIFFQSLLGLSLGYIDTIMLSNYNDIAVGAIGNANSILGFFKPCVQHYIECNGRYCKPIPRRKAI